MSKQLWLELAECAQAGAGSTARTSKVFRAEYDQLLL